MGTHKPIRPNRPKNGQKGQREGPGSLPLLTSQARCPPPRWILVWSLSFFAKIATRPSCTSRPWKKSPFRSQDNRQHWVIATLKRSQPLKSGPIGFSCARVSHWQKGRSRLGVLQTVRTERRPFAESFLALHETWEWVTRASGPLVSSSRDGEWNTPNYQLSSILLQKACI